MNTSFSFSKLPASRVLNVSVQFRTGEESRPPRPCPCIVARRQRHPKIEESCSKARVPCPLNRDNVFTGDVRSFHHLLTSRSIHRQRGVLIESKAEEQSWREQVQRLNRLYIDGSTLKSAVQQGARSGLTKPEGWAGSWQASSLVTERHTKTGLVEDLPLCFETWILLPGSQEVLHITDPHHVQLFENILSQQRPWRYGHMLRRAEKLIGVVAEVQEVERFNDGRMLLLVSAVSKMRVLRPSQKVPFLRARVEREQDEEETLVGALYPGLSKPSSNKNGVRSSGPEWDPEVAAAAVMTHELRRREKELWDCYDQVRLLTAKLRMDGRLPPLPLSLLSLLPPDRSQVPGSSPRPRSVEQKWEDPATVVSRVQRLSYAVGSALPDVQRAEGRQKFLEAYSIRERMDLAAELMTGRCKELAARVAVKQALADASTNKGS